MKINRSTKLKLFGTKSKMEKLENFRKEFIRVANYIFENYEIPEKKSQFLDSKVYNKLKKETNTWLTSHPLQDILNFCYGQLKAYNSLVENYKDECNELAKERVKNKKEFEELKKKNKLTFIEEKRLKYIKKILKRHPKYPDKPSKPFLKDNAFVQLSTQCVLIQQSRLKDFDLIFHFHSLGNKLVFDVPSKQTKHYNKLFDMNGSIRNNTILLGKGYVKISFEIETGKKKEEGKLASIDSNIGNLAFYDQVENKLILDRLTELLQKIKRKKNGFKAWYRAKIELKEYINYALKNEIDWESLKLLVIEDLKNIKLKMSVKDRLTKNIRSVFYHLSFKYILEKIERLCKDNRVSFRKVKPFYTSITCSECGHIEKRNRLTQESFKCLKCGFELNADLNASRNILNRFINGKYGSVFKTKSLMKNVCFS